MFKYYIENCIVIMTYRAFQRLLTRKKANKH